MILGHREQKIWVSRVELEFVNCVPVTYVMLNASHRHRTEDTDDTSRASDCQQRFPSILLVGPCTCVVVLIQLIDVVKESEFQ